MTSIFSLNGVLTYFFCSQMSSPSVKWNGTINMERYLGMYFNIFVEKSKIKESPIGIC